MWSTPQTLEHPFLYNGSDGVDHIMLVGKIQWFKVLVVCCLILFFIIVLFFFFLFMFFLHLRLSWMDVLLRMVWRSSWRLEWWWLVGIWCWRGKEMREIVSLLSLFFYAFFLSFFFSKFFNTLFLLFVTRSPFYFFGSLIMAGGFLVKEEVKVIRLVFFFWWIGFQ